MVSEAEADLLCRPLDYPQAVWRLYVSRFLRITALPVPCPRLEADTATSWNFLFLFAILVLIVGAIAAEIV